MSEPAVLSKESLPTSTATGPSVVLEAAGITKSYRRGVWPRRRELAVLRGAEQGCGNTAVTVCCGRYS